MGLFSDRIERYSRVAIGLHWIVAALVLFNLWLGLFHDSLPDSWRVMPVHKATGFTILALSVARLGWRMAHPAPPVLRSVPPWQRLTATATHWAFYALLILLPLTGWAMVSVAEPRRPLDWYGLFAIPYLPVSKAVGGIGHDLHEVLGYAMAALVVLHVAAALYHHLLLRDSTLLRMLPFGRRASRW